MIIYRRPSPVVGDIRPESGFAWLPTKISVEQSVWMQRYSRELMWFKPMNMPGYWVHEIWAVYDRQRDMVYDPTFGRGWVRSNTDPIWDVRPPYTIGSAQEAPEPQNEVSKPTSGNKRQNFMSK